MSGRAFIPSLWRIPILTALLVVVIALAMFAGAQPAAATDHPTPTPTPTPTAEVENFEVALYLYTKLDPSAPAGWSNSGLQTLCATQTGVDWFAAVPESCKQLVCENHFDGIQQDKVKFVGTFTWPEHIEYPVDDVGWPPIYDAKHEELPPFDCTTPTPTPTPIPDPCVPPTDACQLPTLPVTGIEAWEWLTPCLIALAGALLLLGRAYNRRRPRLWGIGDGDGTRHYDGTPRLHPDFGNSILPALTSPITAPAGIPLVNPPSSAKPHLDAGVDPWAHVRDRD